MALILLRFKTTRADGFVFSRMFLVPLEPVEEFWLENSDHWICRAERGTRSFPFLFSTAATVSVAGRLELQLSSWTNLDYTRLQIPSPALGEK